MSYQMNEQSHKYAQDAAYRAKCETPNAGYASSNGTHASMNGSVTLHLPVASAKSLLLQTKQWVRVLNALSEGPACPEEVVVLNGLVNALERAFA